MNPNRFAERLPAVIAAARKKRGLSQKGLSLKMECTRTYVSKIENGKAMPTLTSLTRFADALETTPHALMWSAQVRAEKAKVTP